MEKTNDNEIFFRINKVLLQGYWIEKLERSATILELTKEEKEKPIT